MSHFVQATDIFHLAVTFTFRRIGNLLLATMLTVAVKFKQRTMYSALC